VFAADTDRRDAVPLAEREEPAGSAAWAKRARGLQSRLIEGWAGFSG
jgi:D-alanyl-D-alanine carboxypeptidase/D-alanyl-D-alanine-endopeptidase (penicillin-binding protein 4)